MSRHLTLRYYSCCGREGTYRPPQLGWLLKQVLYGQLTRLSPPSPHPCKSLATQDYLATTLCIYAACLTLVHGKAIESIFDGSTCGLSCGCYTHRIKLTNQRCKNSSLALSRPSNRPILIATVCCRQRVQTKNKCNLEKNSILA